MMTPFIFYLSFALEKVHRRQTLVCMGLLYKGTAIEETPLNDT